MQSANGYNNESKLQATRKDFRSDTITIQNDEVFDVMKAASRGDDVYRDDHTTEAFQDRMAKLSGKEAALFCVSGTQTNQLALRAHLKQPPHSVLCDARAHVHRYEAGGLAFHSQAMVLNPAPSNGRYLRWDEDIQPNLIMNDNIHFCPTVVISLENTLGGVIFPQEEIVKISNEAHKLGLIMHLDGARLWETAAATGLSLEELCRPFDTVSLCLSKGLGAPIGSVLVGPSDVIKKCIHLRKLFGGGMRQAGMLTAAANYYYDLVFPQLPRVHKLAKKLAQGLADEGASITQPVQTNMVWFDPKPLGFTTDEFTETGAKVGITCGNRLVLHYLMNDETIDATLNLVRQLKKQSQDKTVPLSELERERTRAFARGEFFDGPTTTIQAVAAGGYGANGPRGRSHGAPPY